MRLVIIACFCLLHPQLWLKESHHGYDLWYTTASMNGKETTVRDLDSGRRSVLQFFDAPFSFPFGVYLHPDRASLDSAWSQDWKQPGFRSECWMVASGVANRLDLLSPSVWKSQSCEHNGENEEERRKLITHELVHVFHGQRNPSPDFADVKGLDWFVEGLAYYAAGQLTPAQLAKVSGEEKLPQQLDECWKGPLRYQLAGSLVRFIDRDKGRNFVRQLLTLTDRPALLARLGYTEQEFLEKWTADLRSGDQKARK